MDELLSSLIAGDANEAEEAQGLGALAGILGGLTVGQAAGRPESTVGLSLGDLLGGLGSSATGGVEAAGPGEGSETGGAQAGGLLSALLGGGGLGSLLGGLMGGAPQQADTGTGGVADALAEKLGVSPQVAATIVSFAVMLLMQAVQKRVTQGRQPTRRGRRRSRGASQAGAAELDLGDLLTSLGGGSRLSADRLAAAGVTERLAAQAGIDEHTAGEGLAEAIELLGQQYGGRSPAAHSLGW